MQAVLFQVTSLRRMPQQDFLFVRWVSPIRPYITPMDKTMAVKLEASWPGADLAKKKVPTFRRG